METVEQILRVMREDIEKGNVPLWADFGSETARDYVARLEAAIKREREAVGNAAKMRKADTKTIAERFPTCHDPALKWVPGKHDTLHIESALAPNIEGEETVQEFADVWDFCEYAGAFSPDMELTDEEWRNTLLWLAS
jgi:hypothetical protein